MSVQLTEKAVSRIQGLYTGDSSIQGKSLRVYVESGGCSSYTYGFKFDTPTERDVKQPFKGFELIVDPDSEKLLEGALIDYKEDFDYEGFAVENPNAKKTCGCGQSFDA